MLKIVYVCVTKNKHFDKFLIIDILMYDNIYVQLVSATQNIFNVVQKISFKYDFTLI